MPTSRFATTRARMPQPPGQPPQLEVTQVEGAPRGGNAGPVDRSRMRAGRHDVISLISAYEASLYGLTKFRSTNGYEQRRQAFFAETGSSRLNAAAAASAIAFVETRLTAGQSTDGAVFFPTTGKPLGPGKIKVRAAGRTFEFESEPEGTSKTLHPRGETPPQR